MERPLRDGARPCRLRIGSLVLLLRERNAALTGNSRAREIGSTSNLHFHRNVLVGAVCGLTIITVWTR